MMNAPLARAVRLAVLIALSCSAASTWAQTQTGVQRLNWLAGCWAFTAGDRLVEEQWMAPRAGSMLGTSRTVRADKVTEYEFVVLREQGEQLAYEVSPSGRPPTVFVSISVTPTGVVFESLQHDFPQRVAYQRNGDQLLAWIEGTRNGNLRRIEYPYQRVACPAN